MTDEQIDEFVKSFPHMNASTSFQAKWLNDNRYNIFDICHKLKKSETYALTLERTNEHLNYRLTNSRNVTLLEEFIDINKSLLNACNALIQENRVLKHNQSSSVSNTGKHSAPK